MSLREVSTASELLAFYDLLVIGAGPAGMAAGVEASAAGARVAVLDENPVRADRYTARSHETVPTEEPISVPTIGTESRSQKRSVSAKSIMRHAPRSGAWKTGTKRRIRHAMSSA